MPAPTAQQPWRDVAVIGLWMVIGLILIDVFINYIFVYPSDNSIPPSKMALFFDWGRSIEGKLVRLIADSDEHAFRSAKSGWPDTAPTIRPSTGPDRDRGLSIASYGMSFSSQILTPLAEKDPTISLRELNAPAAPPNCVYGFYLDDRDRHHADVVTLCLLSSNIYMMQSTSGINNQFELPLPFTYPMYFLDRSDHLLCIEPEIRSLAQMRETLLDPIKQYKYRESLKRDDVYFDPFLFDKNWLDGSALIRMARRAVARHRADAIDKRVYNESGFVMDSPVVQTLRVLIAQFAKSVRANGQVPVLIMIHSIHSGNRLFDALSDVIQLNDVPYLNSNMIAPANDRSNYISDGHFTPEANAKLAAALRELLHKLLPGRLE